MVEQGGHKARKAKGITISNRNSIYERAPSEESYRFFHRHPITGKVSERGDDGTREK